MKRLFLCSVALACLATSALAADVTVNLKVSADMKSLRDPKAKDTFTVTTADAQIKSTFRLLCQAGKKGLLTRTDEACAVGGDGSVIFPNGTEKPRIKYSGGLVVKSDGFTDGTSIVVDYLALGQVPASKETFGGNLILKPEVPSATALGFGEKVIAGLKKKVGMDGGTEVIDDRTDTIEFANFKTPSSGLPSDKGCSWRGSGVYAYQTSSWFLNLEADCGGKQFKLTGNMPWVDTENGARYDVTLTLPTAKVTTDDALFADATNNDALFAAADGISGTLNMKLGSNVTVQVEGRDEQVPSTIEAEGSLTGQNVPPELVRSFSSVIAVLSRTFFGA